MCLGGGGEKVLELLNVARWCCDALEGCGAIGDGLHEFVRRRKRGVSDGLVLKRDSVAEASAVGSTLTWHLCVR